MLYWDVLLMEHKADKLQLVPWAITSHQVAISLPPMLVAAKKAEQLTQLLVKEEAWVSILKVQLVSQVVFQRLLHSMS